MQAITNTLANTLPYLERGTAYTASLWRDGSGAVYQAARQIVSTGDDFLAISMDTISNAHWAPFSPGDNLLDISMDTIRCSHILLRTYLACKDIYFLFGGYFPKNIGLMIANVGFGLCLGTIGAFMKLGPTTLHTPALQPGRGHIIQSILRSDLFWIGTIYIAHSVSFGIMLSLLSTPASFFNPELLTHPLQSDISLFYMTVNLMSIQAIMCLLYQARAIRKAEQELFTWIAQAPNREERDHRLHAGDNIRWAVILRKYTLDLNGLSLTTLPPTLWTLTWLKFLNLSNNQLTTLPPQVANLRNLRELDLRNNHLSSLPEEITSLPQYSLKINGNPDLVLTETLRDWTSRL